MLEIVKIRDQKEAVVAGLDARGVENAAQVIDNILGLDDERKRTQTELDKSRSRAKDVSKSIGKLFAQGKKEEAEAAKNESSSLRDSVDSGEARLKEIVQEIHDQLVTLPNVCHPSVPVGHTDADNQVVSENGLQVSLPDGAKPHWELIESLGIVDLKLGAKITGAGFPVYRGKGAQLQRGLIRFFLEEAGKQGFEEIQPPLMVNADTGYGTGQLPDKDGQMYHATEDNLFLIPTAEVPITNIFRNEIVKEDGFPYKMCGYTPCFRREAGSYGKDVKGLNRLHQFDKVEIVVIEHPDRSYERLEKMVEYVCSLLDKLELPYRKLLLCTGDTGFTSAKTFDMEVYSAAQGRWLEVSSISNFETFQANRLKLRYKDENKKTRLAHTLNGSALALPRIFAALIENNQQADGSILLPEVLHEYCGFDRIG